MNINLDYLEVNHTKDLEVIILKSLYMEVIIVNGNHYELILN